MTSALEALQRLREGNRRFASGMRAERLTDAARRRELVAGQQPSAIVLGCSDSRVPAEIVFDQGLGDLFVIRVAGNIVASSQLGSVEFALEQLGVRLVVVLGHSNCGAIEATLAQLERPTQPGSPGLNAITDRIRCAVEPLLKDEKLSKNRELLMTGAVRANVNSAANQLRQQFAREGLLIVEAEYSLESGVVDFFNGAPE